MILSLLFAKRRAAFVALALALPYFIALLNWRRAKRAIGVTLAMSVVLAVYAVIFSSTGGILGEPVRLIRSVADTKGSGRHAASNRYRLVENLHLATDIRDYALLGRGFGQPFSTSLAPGQMPPGMESEEKSLTKQGVPLWRYIPHNQILWVWVKGGILGFTAFWFFILATIAHGTYLARTLKTPYFRALAAFTVILVSMTMLVAYVDMGLTAYRNMIYMGAMLGMMVRLRAIETQEEKAFPST
jgi:O-antigen ligase